MTKEELKQEAEDKADIYVEDKYDEENDCFSLGYARFVEGYLASAEPREKRIEELEQKISILLSCKNCPENKGGFICVKEYENKCLAQKIQYIKELQEEIKNLKKTYRKQRNKRIDELQKENAELKESFFVVRCVRSGCPYLHLETRNCLKVGGFFTAVSNKHCPMMQNLNSSIQLTKAKEIIKKLINTCCSYGATGRVTAEAEQFLNGE